MCLIIVFLVTITQKTVTWNHFFRPQEINSCRGLNYCQVVFFTVYPVSCSAVLKLLLSIVKCGEKTIKYHSGAQLNDMNSGRKYYYSWIIQLFKGVPKQRPWRRCQTATRSAESGRKIWPDLRPFYGIIIFQMHDRTVLEKLQFFSDSNA